MDFFTSKQPATRNEMLAHIKEGRIKILIGVTVNDLVLNTMEDMVDVILSSYLCDVKFKPVGAISETHGVLLDFGKIFIDPPSGDFILIEVTADAAEILDRGGGISTRKRKQVRPELKIVNHKI